MCAQLRASRDDDGMSLVEVLVALLLIGIIMSAMVASILSGLTSVQRVNGQVAANQLANERIESLRTRSFSSVAPVPPATSISTTEDPVPRGGIAYTTTWSSTWVDSPCNNAVTSPYDYLQLRVRVAWTVRNTQNKSLEVVSLRAATPYDGGSFTPVRVDALTC